MTVSSNVVPLNTSVPMDVNVSDKLMVSIVLKFWKNDVGTIVCAVEFSVTVFKVVGNIPEAVAVVPPNR